MSYIDKRGYVRISVKGKDRKEHELMWEIVNGPIPQGYDLHHKDGDKTHNVIENLELIEHGAHSSLHTKGRKRSDDTRHKISEAKKGTPAWNRGLSGYHVGSYKPMTQEHKDHISASCKGREAWNKGKPWSEQAKKHSSESHKGLHSSPKTEFKKGEHPSPNTEFKPGVKFTQEMRLKLSEAQRKRYCSHKDATS